MAPISGHEDPANVTLLKVAEADVCESKILGVEYEGLRAGTSTARGWGPCSTERQRTTHFREIEAERKLGDLEEMFGHESHRNGRKIDGNSSHRPPTTKRKSKKKVEKKQNKKPKSQSKAANEHSQPENAPPENRPVAIARPARQVPQFGAFVIGLLQYQHFGESLLWMWGGP